jgi:hypothetical protein
MGSTAMKREVSAVVGLQRKIGGRFFDGGSLAIAVLVILGATALLMHSDLLKGPAVILFLVSAVTAALLENVVRTARNARAISETMRLLAAGRGDDPACTKLA